MNILKQSTAATIKLGAFVDDTDGKTAETALTISQADIRLSKNGGDFAQTNNAAGATHDENGYYDIPLNTTDTNTLGRLRVAVSESGALPVWQDFIVVTANVYDSLVGGSDKLDVNAAELGGTSQTGNDVGADVNEILTDTGTTLDTLIKDIPTVAEFEARTIAAADYFDPAADTVATVTNLTNLPTMPADWLTASGLKADAVAEIQAGLALEATLTAIKGAGWVSTETLHALKGFVDEIETRLTSTRAGYLDKLNITGNVASSTEVAAVQADLDNPDQYKADVSGIPAAVWAYTTRTLSSFGSLIADIWAHATRTLSAFGFTVATNSDANVTAIKAKTDNLPTSPAPSNEYDAELAAIQADLDNPAQYKADVSGLALESTLTAIKGAGWTMETLAAIDVLIDAIKAKTDNLPASPAATGAAMTLANDAITAAKISADAITEIQNGLAKSADLQGVEDKVDVIAIDTTTEIPASITALSGKVDTIDNFLDTEIAAILEDTGITLPATLAAIEGKVDTADAVVDAIKLKTDNLPASPAATGAAMTLTAAYDKAKDDVLTPLGVVDGIVDAIKLKTDTIPASPAQAGEYTAAIAAIPTTPLLAANYTAPDNAGIAAIKAQTDLIPASPAPSNEYDVRMTAIQADLDNADQYKADVSGLALEATLTAMKGAGWTDETLVAMMTAIEAIVPGSGATAQEVWEYVTRTLTDPNSYKADVSGLATTAHLQDVEDKVDIIDTISDAVRAKTDNLPASPAPANEYDARMTAIQADLDNPNQYKADVSGIPAAVWGYATRTLSSFGTLVSDIWTHVTRTLTAFGFTVATNSDANVTAIKNKTDNLPAQPAPASEYDAELAAIQADLNNPAQYKADVSGLALEATSQSILEDTGTTIPAAITGMNDIAVSDIMNEIVVGTYTFEQILKILAAKMAGKASGGGTTTITYRGLDDMSDVIVETVDSNGNRSAVTLAV